MSTVAPPLVTQLAGDWVSKCGLKSAKISGVIGDARHAARGGYHIGRKFQPKNNYSVVRPDDLGGPDDAASAIDVTMDASDMRLCTARLVAAYSNVSDPRRKYINAFNGTTDSKTAKRWDVYARKVKSATSDHLWHVHLEIRRKYVGSVTAMAAILSILRGESVAAYKARIAPSRSAGSVKTSSTVGMSAPPFPGILRRNDEQRGASVPVVVFQNQLIKRGVPDVGKADGFFGPKLETAVKWWQRKVKLTADGVVGKVTWPTPWTHK